MTQADRYQESRDVWQDCNHRQEFEHDLINRKTTWSLTGQTILFAAYGVTLGSDLVDKTNEFRQVIALSGFMVAVVTLVGVLAIIRSKYLAWRQYNEFYSAQSPEGLRLPGPLNKKSLQWGVDTLNTCFTLLPDALLPIIFAAAWLCLL